MEAPTKVVFAFDPDESNISVLTDRVGKILWGCIRTQHIVSQHFNGNVQDVTLRIAEEKPKKYEEFKKIIRCSGLHIFGTYCPKTKRMGFELSPRLDDEFWMGVWDYITKEKELVYEFSPVM